MLNAQNPHLGFDHFESLLSKLGDKNKRMLSPDLLYWF